MGRSRFRKQSRTKNWLFTLSAIAARSRRGILERRSTTSQSKFYRATDDSGEFLCCGHACYYFKAVKGFFQNSTVLVFNWNENPVPAVNRETLGNLHSIMTQKNQVGVINVSQVG